MAAIASSSGLFQIEPDRQKLVNEFKIGIQQLCQSLPQFDTSLVDAAANYLYSDLTSGAKPVISSQASAICSAFEKFIQRGKKESLLNTTDDDKQSVTHSDWYELFRYWIASFVADSTEQFDTKYINEAASVLLAKKTGGNVLDINPVRDIDGLLGDHPILDLSLIHI